MACPWAHCTPLPMISQTKNTRFKKFPLRADSKQLKYGRPAGPRDILTVTLTDIFFMTVRSRECERYSRSVADAGVLSKARAQGGNLFGHLQICRD